MLNSSYLNNSSINKMNSSSVNKMPSLLPSNSVSNLNNNNLHKYNQHAKQNNNSLTYNNNSSPSYTLNRSKQLGLNPNINIQDEYVQNLLKQIHFMNMQIKLLKQKQSQSQNNALWGIINRTKQPLIKNIVESSEKYQNMKYNMDTQHQSLSNQNIKLADLQNAILKQYQYLQNKIQAIKKKKQTFQTSIKQKQGKNTIKILQYTARLKQVTDQKDIQKKRNTTFVNQYTQLITQGQKQQSKTAYQLTKIRNDQVIEEQMQKQKINQIAQIKHKIALLKQKFLSNEDYQKAQQQQTGLKEKINKLQKQISSANFELLQLTQSIKLAEIQTDKQIKERKKYTQQYEAAKTMLLQISLLNLGRKHKQTQNRKRQSIQIQKGEYQTKKLQKNLQQIKKKLTKCQDTQNQLRIQVQSLQRELKDLKQKRQSLKQQLTVLTNKNQQQDKIFNSCSNEIRKLNDVHQKVANQQFMLTCQLQSIERQIQYLRGRKDFLNQSLNLKDTLNQTRLQDLQRVVQKNIDLNQTVKMLMGKWQQIKQFSRM